MADGRISKPIAFLQELSHAIAERAPGAMLIAEESTAWPGVTRTGRDRRAWLHA